MDIYSKFQKEVKCKVNGSIIELRKIYFKKTRFM